MTTKTTIEKLVDAYVTDNQLAIELAVRRAFIAGYSEGLATAERIYSPKHDTQFNVAPRASDQ